MKSLTNKEQIEILEYVLDNISIHKWTCMLIADRYKEEYRVSALISYLDIIPTIFPVFDQELNKLTKRLKLCDTRIKQIDYINHGLFVLNDDINGNKSDQQVLGYRLRLLRRVIKKLKMTK